MRTAHDFAADPYAASRCVVCLHFAERHQDGRCIAGDHLPAHDAAGQVTSEPAPIPCRCPGFAEWKVDASA